MDARLNSRLWFITAAGFVVLMLSMLAAGQSPRTDGPVPMISDWSHHHLLTPDSDDVSMDWFRNDPRWRQNWYLHHPEQWWPGQFANQRKRAHRDWSVALGEAYFEPLFDASFTFSIGAESGNGTFTTTLISSGEYLATAGTLNVTGGSDIGTYGLIPGGPSLITGPNGAFVYDDLLFPTTNPVFDTTGGPLWAGSGGLEINIWGGSSANNYSFYTGTASGNYPIAISGAGTVTLTENANPDPGGGVTYPAKFTFNLTSTPSCANDFVVIGIPTSPESGGQANIVGLNNLYSNAGGTGYCTTTGPTVIFAYASGTGQVPASVVINQAGTQTAYVENLAGSSYFHVLTIGTTGTNGTSATAAVVPGTGNNAVDQRVLLSPNGGTTNQSSTNAPYVVYTASDANDVAFVTTYSLSGSGSGYLYKISNVFNSSAPTLVWSVPITAAPSAPVYDSVSNKVFFTDSNGRIDYVVNTSSPSVVYSAVLASGTTSENAVIVDSSRQMVYAFFNSNGTNALVVQTPTSMASAVSVPVGTHSTTYTGPYTADFNHAWYSGSGTPVMYVAGTGTGTLPTLYSVGFTGNVMNTTTSASVALATGAADSVPVQEFYNAALSEDFLFAGVTNNCVATAGGGTAGCVMSLNITAGFPTVNASTTALAAGGGPGGFIVDNDSSVSGASSIYYATKTGQTLVKATQSALQ